MRARLLALKLMSLTKVQLSAVDVQIITIPPSLKFTSKEHALPSPKQSFFSEKVVNDTWEQCKAVFKEDIHNALTNACEQQESKSKKVSDRESHLFVSILNE